MSSLKGFFKDTFIYGIAAILPRVINFLLVKVHTDALPANNYAENTNFYVWIALLAVLLTFGMETTFFRFYKSEKKKDALISTSFISIAIAVLVFVTASFAFAGFFESLFDFANNPLQLKLLIGITALDTLMVVPFAYLRASNRPIRYTFIKLLNVAIIVVVNLLFLKYIPQWKSEGQAVSSFLNTAYTSTEKVNFIFIANILGSIVSFALLIPYLIKFKWSFDNGLFKKMINYSWPIAVAGVAYVINENLDKILIGKMIDKNAMGIYSACYKLAIFMNLYIMAFRLGAEPFFFNNSDKKNIQITYAKILNYFTIVGALCFLGIVVFIDLLKQLFINEHYWEALLIVPIVLLANLFLGIYHNLSIWYKLTDKTRFGMYFSIFGAFITVIINLMLIPVIGYVASAWATLAAYSTMAIISYFVGKKHYPVPYNIKKIALYLILATAIAYIYFNTPSLRNNYLISLIIILVFTSIIYFNERKELKTIFKK